MNNQALVSVAVPTYNNAPFLKQALDSILSQSYQNIEVVISDNASTDNTPGIIKSIQDRRVKYFRNPQTVSFIENWNKAIKLASADYIAFYHSDDVYSARIVEKEMDFLNKHPLVGGVCTLGKLIDEAGRVISDKISLPKELEATNSCGLTELLKLLMVKSGSFIFTPTFMARREVFDTIGYFRDKGESGSQIDGGSDMDYFLRVSQRYQFGIIGEKLINKRVSQLNLTGQYMTQRLSRSVHFVVIDDFLKLGAVSKNIPAGIQRQYDFNKFWDDCLIAVNLIRNKSYKHARNRLRHAFSYKYIIPGISNLKNFTKVSLWIALNSAGLIFPDKCFDFTARFIFGLLQKFAWNGGIVYQ